nr:MAG TPA: hypothetical protein [Caudoviricetes sp.]
MNTLPMVLISIVLLLRIVVTFYLFIKKHGITCYLAKDRRFS